MIPRALLLLIRLNGYSRIRRHFRLCLTQPYECFIGSLKVQGKLAPKQQGDRRPLW